MKIYITVSPKNNLSTEVLMKKISLVLLVLCGFMFPALCFARNDKANLETSLKYVDMNGEAFSYQNNDGIVKLVNEKLPAALKIFTRDMSEGDLIDSAVQSFLKLLNLNAFKSMAHSSRNSGDDIYVTKTFALIDKNAESILIDPASANGKLAWMDLPADTRLAFRFHLNLAHVWKLVKKEIETNPQPQYKAVLQQINAIKQQGGVDIEALLNSVNGDVELVIAGTSLDNIAARAAIPDKNGALTALAKKMLGDKIKNNVLNIPLDGKFNVNVVFTPGVIIAYTDARMISRFGHTYGSLPHVRKMANRLPRSGTGYFIFDTSKEVLATVKACIGDEPKLVELFDMFVKPVCIISVGRDEKDGFSSTVVSNFSIAQVQQVLSSGGAAVPILAGMLLPALNSARDRARVISCVTNLKQFGLAFMMYSNDHNDVLPADINAIIKGGYVNNKEVFKNIIYIPSAANTKLGAIRNPSSYIVAVCNREGHNKTALNVLFADGHVESFAIGEHEQTADFLCKKYNLSGAEADRIRMAYK